MSANVTSTSPLAEPSLSDFSALIRPWVDALLIGHSFVMLLLPLLIALFYFSTPESRRRPIFILNVIVIILAFASGTMIDALTIHSVLSIQDPWPTSINIAIGFIGAFQSLLVDLILLVRLISVHPLNHLGPIRFAALIALPVLLKIGRFINLIVFVKVLVVAARSPQGSEIIAVLWSTAPYLKIEWFAQMVDNTYASIAFLWTIRDWGHGSGVTSNIHPTRVTFAQRMRTLFRIALSNFIIPTLFSIAQLIVVYRSVNTLIVNQIIFVNTMLAVFGVVFATVWAGSVAEPRDEVERYGGACQCRWVEKDSDSDRMQKFALPGLGSWHAATVPPAATFGSIRYMECDPMKSDERVLDHVAEGHDRLGGKGTSSSLVLDSESLKARSINE